MSKVIEIKDHIELERQKKQDAEKRRLVQELLQFLQCSTCRMKCSRCGSQVDVLSDLPYPPDIPFNLCKICKEEYLEYQRSLHDLDSKDTLWHNQEWKAMWSLWIEYQKASRKFINSREVRELFEQSKK
ncbi:MAG: hypothetical protein V2A69_04350 [Pseudomonadota bacterium]